MWLQDDMFPREVMWPTFAVSGEDLVLDLVDASGDWSEQLFPTDSQRLQPDTEITYGETYSEPAPQLNSVFGLCFRLTSYNLRAPWILM